MAKKDTVEGEDLETLCETLFEKAESLRLVGDVAGAKKILKIYMKVFTSIKLVCHDH